MDVTSPFYAHTNEFGQRQRLSDHLIQTAKAAQGFAPEFLKDLCFNVGLLHDIGKYQHSFQQKLCGVQNQVEHSGCGAKESIYLPQFDFISRYIAAYCIMGHHGGLPDGGSYADDEFMPTLCGRLKRCFEDYSQYSGEIGTLLLKNDDFSSCMSEMLKNEPQKNRTETMERAENTFSVVIRMVYSCLVDADFLDTEQFCSDKEICRTISTDFSKCLLTVLEKLNSYIPNTPVKSARFRLQKQAADNYYNLSNADSKIHILQMPTGSGKTLCSIRLALEAIKKNRKKRIIYVIPYTGIIEQTADIFREMFGQCVLEHHSNYDYDKIDDETRQLYRYSCENYDAPIIVTTNVQFFESFYSNKSSRLRKLHNIADSVIVFDEVHKMPIKYLSPCLDAVVMLTKLFGCEAFFLSATMPDFQSLFDKYSALSVKTDRLITDKSDFHFFKTCDYNYIGLADNEKIIADVLQKHNALIVVNSRKSARELFLLLKKSAQNVYHLSTYMTPYDRKIKLDIIRQRLLKNEQVYVISTSLIEAGVDIDFDFVYRELAGLDSILQAGGRCNREGKKSGCAVTVWKSDSGTFGEQGVLCNITEGLFRKYGANIAEDEGINEYFANIFLMNNDLTTKYRFADFAHYDKEVISVDFKRYAEKFKLIEDTSTGVAIRRDERSGELISKIEKNGDLSAKRNLQKYCASVHFNELNELVKTGAVSDFGTGQYVLLNDDYYSDELGLQTENCRNYII